MTILGKCHEGTWDSVDVCVMFFFWSWVGAIERIATWVLDLRVEVFHLQ